MPALAELDDQQLIRQARHGKTEAYGILAQRYQTRLFQLSYRMLGDSSEALDLTQEALIRGFTALPRFDPERPFGPWIQRIVVNLALTWRGKRGVPTISMDTVAFDDQPAIDIPADAAANPEALALAGEQRIALQRAILSLPPAHRAVVVLRHYQELSYEEIAETLAIPLSDVKSRLFRARRQLRDILEGQS